MNGGQSITGLRHNPTSSFPLLRRLPWTIHGVLASVRRYITTSNYGRQPMTDFTTSHPLNFEDAGVCDNPQSRTSDHTCNEYCFAIRGFIPRRARRMKRPTFENQHVSPIRFGGEDKQQPNNFGLYIPEGPIILNFFGLLVPGGGGRITPRY